MRRYLALLTALSLLPLGGCSLSRGIYSNYRAVEELQVVRTLGVDADDSGLILSAAAARPASGTPVILRRPAASVPQGMDALRQRTPKGQLYFAHTEYVVLGRRFAAGGVEEVLDFLERDVHTRMGAGLFVMRTGTAEALITGPGEDWDVSDVLATAAAGTDARGDSHVFDVRETAVALSEYGAALVCALNAADTQDSVFGLSPGQAAVPAGYGILKDGALIGFLDEREARAASLMLGKLGTVTQEIPFGGGTVTLELSCGAPEIVRADGGLLVHAAPSAVIVGVNTPRPVTDAGGLAALTAAVNAAVKEDLTRVLARSRADRCDFLALRRALRRQGVDPASLPADFPAGLVVRVEVDSAVRHGYDLHERSGTDGGAAA